LINAEERASVSEAPYPEKALWRTGVRAMQTQSAVSSMGSAENALTENVDKMQASAKKYFITTPMVEFETNFILD